MYQKYSFNYFFFNCNCLLTYPTPYLFNWPYSNAVATDLSKYLHIQKGAALLPFVLHHHSLRPVLLVGWEQLLRAQLGLDTDTTAHFLVFREEDHFAVLHISQHHCLWRLLVDQESAHHVLVPDCDLLLTLAQPLDLTRLLRLQIGAFLDRVIIRCHGSGLRLTWILWASVFYITTWERLTSLQVNDCVWVEPILYQGRFIPRIQVLQWLPHWLFVLSCHVHYLAILTSWWPVFQTRGGSLRHNFGVLLSLEMVVTTLDLNLIIISQERALDR